MFTNYFRIAIRSFRRNKFFSFLNIFGLSIGIATAILSFLFVQYELSYDKFHEKSDRTYRIAVDALSGNTVIKQLYNPAPMPAALYNEFDEIEAITRISGTGGAVKVKYEDKVYKESNVILADTTFFDIFSAEFVYGTPNHSILEPNKIVITEKMAKKYFGDENPIGKIFELDDEDLMTVSAVIKEFPTNSHFHFDMVGSLLSFDGFYNGTRWFANNFKIYLLLQEKQNYLHLQDKLPYFVDKYLYNGNYEESSKGGNKWELNLQPLSYIHLNSHLSGEFEANGNAAYINIFGIVAIFILIIACINFVNLSTAKSSTRAREIGIRKVIGSGKRELIKQFIGESLIISFIALFFALLLVKIAFIYLPEFLGITLSMNVIPKLHAVLILLGLGIGVGVFSGIYPALVLSSFKPVDIFRDKLLSGTKNNWSRNILVVFQFTISIVLIVGSILISKQLDFIQNEKLGFDKENILVINNINIIQDDAKTFKNELSNIVGIDAVSISHKLPGKRFNNIGFGAEEFDGGYTLNLAMTDPDFQNVMKFKMVKGRFFSNDFGTDTAAVVLNESAVKLIGWDDPIGKNINNWGQKRLNFKVIGVVEDLHYESMHQEIRPMAFFHMYGSWGWTPKYVSVRTNTQNISELISSIENVWKKFSPDMPLEYSFFDEDYDKLYKNEMQTKKLFVMFSMLAVFIGCLGLFGLAAFIVEKRRQEIGIRKVLGASSEGLVLLLSGQFSKWILFANLFAWPLAYFMMKEWLKSFAYRIEIGILPFVFAGIMAFIIAILTVGWQTIKAATTNPVDSIKYE